jgi:predicted SAM-dependent methyltransferase
LLAKPSPLNINLGSDRFSMFNKRRDIPMDFSHTTISRRRPITSYAKVRLIIGNCIRNKRIFMNLKGPGLCLDIGPGPNMLPHNINLDYEWRPGLDVCCDITKGLPFPNNYVGSIFSEHCIEHIPQRDAVWVFSEFFRIMQPGAWLRIIVPDLDIYLDQLAAAKRNQPYSMPYANDDKINGLYTPAMSLNRIMHDHGHCFIYDFDTICKMLSAAKFINVQKSKFGDSPINALALDSENRAVESLYVNAQKPHP